MKLPVLFLGHGSPMNAIEDTPYSRGWAELGRRLRQQYGNEIKAILSISAHWCTDGIAVTAMDKPRTIHDFGGFPQALFDMQYPAEGSLQLARQVKELLGGDVHEDFSWGLDHGTWGVLCHVFPEADIPVVQLSLNMRLDFAQHYAIGQQLAALREQGVLIVASGDIVHNLRAMGHGGAYPWAVELQEWVNQRLLTGDVDALADANQYPDSLPLAAPTPEHLLPLLYALGAANGDAAALFNDDIVYRSLSMTSVVWE